MQSSEWFLVCCYAVYGILWDFAHFQVFLIFWSLHMTQILPSMKVWPLKVIAHLVSVWLQLWLRAFNPCPSSSSISRLTPSPPSVTQSALTIRHPFLNGESPAIVHICTRLKEPNQGKQAITGGLFQSTLWRVGWGAWNGGKVGGGDNYTLVKISQHIVSAFPHPQISVWLLAQGSCATGRNVLHVWDMQLNGRWGSHDVLLGSGLYVLTASQNRMKMFRAGHVSKSCSFSHSLQNIHICLVMVTIQYNIVLYCVIGNGCSIWVFTNVTCGLS